MGTITFLAAAFSLCAFAFAAFCAWVLYFVYQSASLVKAKIQRRKRTMSNPSANSDVLCPCIFKRLSTVQFTMSITVATVACMFLAVLSFALEMAALALTCNNDCANAKSQPKAVGWFRAPFVFFMLVGYALMFVTHFERLRLTFSGTAQRLPKWAPNALYAIMIMGTLLMILANVFQYSDTKKLRLSVLCSVLTILLYVGGVSALIRTFFKKTMAVANSFDHSDMELMHTATRVTMSALVSVLCCTISFLAWNILVVVSPNCFVCILLVNLYCALDLCLNAFCLMCTFRRAEKHYLFVFHRVHNWFLSRVAAVDLVAMAGMTLAKVKSLSADSGNSDVNIAATPLPEIVVPNSQPHSLSI